MATTPEGRLRALGITLPELLPVIGSYRLAKRHRDTVYVAGHVALKLDRSGLITGKVGNEISTQQAQEAARVCALHMLASLRAEIGSLDHVTSILKVFGMVNVAPGFGDLATVLDGCTDQLADVFGDDTAVESQPAASPKDLPVGSDVTAQPPRR